MGHIGRLRVYMVGKKCLEVRLRFQKIYQCTNYAMSKISQQVSRQPLFNQSARLFHRVYINWLDLEDGKDSYQGGGSLVRRTMLPVFEAKGMTVTYFTKSVKKRENLPLTQNLVNWLAKNYNLEVKVIRLDNELNWIKTSEWYNQNKISFESFAPDTHAPNDGAERFGQLIIEKVQAIRLSANLPHKLWKEIVSTASYPFN